MDVVLVFFLPSRRESPVASRSSSPYSMHAHPTPHDYILVNFVSDHLDRPLQSVRHVHTLPPDYPARPAWGKALQNEARKDMAIVIRFPSFHHPDGHSLHARQSTGIAKYPFRKGFKLLLLSCELTKGMDMFEI